ncbi:MAG: metallopeptidase TldD-related protein [Anaerolineaceae bacterium]|jgi:predicted Zn-dependent protease
MSNQVIDLLKQLRQAALKRNLMALISYHEEDSYLMRFANSSISLNTNEHLISLDFIAFDGRKKASYSMIVNPTDFASMEKGLDILAEMLPHAQPLTYDPTFPVYTRDVVDERSFDPFMCELTNEERLAYFNTLGEGLESDDVKLSGIFSSGTTTTATITTANEFTQYFRATDAQITAVLSSESLKWEVNAEQSAQMKKDLDARSLHADLALLVQNYQQDQAVQLPVGKYTVVLGPAATAELVQIMSYYAMTGSALMQGYSFLKEEDQGKQVFSDQFNLIDDPRDVEIFGQEADRFGLTRQPFPLVSEGQFQAFMWDQDSADEFGKTPTGHDVSRTSLVINAGTEPIESLKDLCEMPRDEDILYIPYIHYMNVVNPSQGMMTGSSRFGALFLKKDGSVQVPYNVRLTQKFTDFFGKNILWMSKKQVAYNVSSSYGRRDPTALRVPRFVCVKDIEISHSNPSY